MESEPRKNLELQKWNVRDYRIIPANGSIFENQAISKIPKKRLNPEEKLERNKPATAPETKMS